MDERFAALSAEALSAIESAGAAADAEASLEAVRVQYLGRKGRVTDLLRGLAQASPEERRTLGAELNALREGVGAALDAAQAR
ncbi:MAG: phenylalanine--tRNA ligase subunit alpha, partial [bacterium]